MSKLEQGIARALHEQAEADVPAVDLWPRIQPQFVTTAPPRQWLALPPTLVGRLSFVLALLLILISAAWALPGLSDILFNTKDGLEQVRRAGLTQKIEQTQTIDGVMVTVHEAYADARRIAVGVTIKDAEQRRYTVNGFDLTGRNGTLIQPYSSSWRVFHGLDGELPLFPGDENDDGETGALFIFDPSAITSPNGKLDLRLSFRPQRFGLGANEHGEPAWVGQGPKIGPFVFDFSVPLNTGKTIAINQTRQAAGVTMTLKRITVLPSAMDVVLCFEQPTGGKTWGPNMTLFVDDLEDSNPRLTHLTGVDAGCMQRTFEISAAQASGWALRVDSLSRGGGPTDETLWTEREEIVGPWVFVHPAWQPEPMVKQPQRGARVNGPKELGILNSFSLIIEPRDGGLMYQFSCTEAKSYLGYRVELFDQVVAAQDQGLHGPVQHCAKGQVLAAGGPIKPPGSLPLRFEARFRFMDAGELATYAEEGLHFIWEADGQLYEEH